MIVPDIPELNHISNVYSKDKTKFVESVNGRLKERVDAIDNIFKILEKGDFYQRYFDTDYKQGANFLIGYSMGGAAALK